MPLDTVKARELIKAANNHRMHPGGELMIAIADQLGEAVKDAGAVNDAVRTARLEVQAAERALADERASTQDSKANTARLLAVVDGMRQIAGGAKGPKKLANDVLLANGFADQPVVEFPKAEGAS